jgi:carboxyl-terminal processing protease
MKSNAWNSFVRVFVVGVVVLILTFAAFGIGLAVGSRSSFSAAAGPAPIRSEFQLPGLGSSLGAGITDILPLRTRVPGTQNANPAPRAPSSSDSGPSTAISGTLDSALFSEALGLLRKQFYGDLPEGKEVTYDAIRGVVDRLGDKHTSFVDPEHAAMFNADLDGHFEGIGAGVELADGGGVQLKYLFAGQPAEKAGLRAGDVITAVDGQDVTALGLMEAISVIRGPRDSKVVLTIRRGGDPTFDVSVQRARIEIPVVETKSLGDGRVSYIALSEFSNVAPDRLAGAMKEALKSNPSGLILDLRGNPGGLLDAAVQIGSYFVTKGNILIERSKDGTERKYERKGEFLLGKTPLVVLVDGGSASASEIVAGAIQDAGTGVLIGQKTYGKGSVQLPNTLSDGSQLRVTIAHWFTPKDRGIHGAGLEPDIAVPLTPEDTAAKKDPQLDGAVEYLLNGSTIQDGTKK